MVRNLLAAIGLVALVLMIGLGAHLVYATRNFDPEALGLYREFIGKLFRTQDMAEAFVWTVPVEEGIDVDTLKTRLRELAVARGFALTGETDFHEEAQRVTGRLYRPVVSLSLCDVQVAMRIADYNNAYTAFTPCTLSVVEDRRGRLWLYSLNMDFLIHGARELPPQIKQDTLRMRRVMREIMEQAAGVAPEPEPAVSG